jgi:hypothetical protein
MYNLHLNLRKLPYRFHLTDNAVYFTVPTYVGYKTARESGFVVFFISLPWLPECEVKPC